MVAKTYVQNGGYAQSSADQPSSGAAKSGGTGGLDNIDSKALREVAELLKSVKRLHINDEMTEISSQDSTK